MLTCRHAHGTRQMTHLAQLVLSSHSVGSVEVKLKPYREVTQQLHITALLHLDEGMLNVSYSQCHPSDRFSRLEGIKRAAVKMKSEKCSSFVYDPAYRLNDYAEAGIVNGPDRLWVYVRKLPILGGALRGNGLDGVYTDSMGRKMMRMPVPTVSTVSAGDIQAFNRSNNELSFLF